MKKMTVLAIFLALVFSASAFAGVKGIGVGLMGGDPSGLTLKQFIGDDAAWDLGIGYSFGGWATVNADYLLHNFSVIKADSGALGLYYGLGAVVGFGNEFHVAARVPLGIDYIFEKTPIELFLEVGPGLGILPVLSFFISESAGIRWYF
ncbi:MAG: hypothetical protein LLG37_11235 [Spirochaetia bacterium]|nr:hypothetical protein [Spirochaetia bacterium]